MQSPHQVTQTTSQLPQPPHGSSVAVPQQHHIPSHPLYQQPPQWKQPPQHTHVPTQTQRNPLTQYLYHLSRSYVAYAATPNPNPNIHVVSQNPPWNQPPLYTNPPLSHTNPYQ